MGSSNSSIYNTNSKNNSINNSRISDKIRDITNYTLTDNENDNEPDMGLDSENYNLKDSVYDTTKSKDNIISSELYKEIENESNTKCKLI